MRKALTLLAIFLVSFATNAQAKKIDLTGYSFSNGFYVQEREFDFVKSIRGGKCTGKIKYPFLMNEDEELFFNINEEIHDFVEIYVICNEGERDNYSVTYDIPESNDKNFFSVRWLTKKDGKLWRIDALTFDRDQGDLAKFHEIFNIFTGAMLDQLDEISGGHMNNDTSWEAFLTSIEERDIQIFIKNGEWIMVFNPTHKLDKLVISKVPSYFLKGDDVSRAR